jgi:hypothetical protein
VKPFSMALLAWFFIRHGFAPWLPAEQIDSYVAGLILLAFPHPECRKANARPEISTKDWI